MLQEIVFESTGFFLQMANEAVLVISVVSIESELLEKLLGKQFPKNKWQTIWNMAWKYDKNNQIIQAILLIYSLLCTSNKGSSLINCHIHLWRLHFSKFAPQEEKDCIQPKERGLKMLILYFEIEYDKSLQIVTHQMSELQKETQNSACYFVLMNKLNQNGMFKI